MPALDNHRIALCVLCAAVLSLGCGVEDRRSQDGYRSASAPAPARGNPDGESGEADGEAAEPFSWPKGPREVAVLTIEGMGEIHIALYPELAPQTVAAFKSRSADAFYEGSTFHRVIPEFMIQGGDPNTKDDDPSNDGVGGPGYSLPDEFSRASHRRGTVSMANTGQPDSGGSQFFIVHQNNPALDGKYSVFGRVVQGMDVVDAITEVDRDESGRWGPHDRPLENVVIQSVDVLAERRLMDAANTP